jgi:SAM-dependent methyltransferase
MILDRKIRVDSSNDRLVYVKRKADQDYWESVHGPLATKTNIEQGDRFVVGETGKYLAPGARVVDAGCGTGATVYGLQKAGFDAYGIDYDEKTVATINSLFPHLKIQMADIHEMPFDDGYFDGVWSLGVIEHFYDGYESIIMETKRVLRPGGYLFLTVPSISPLKNFKTKLGLYEEIKKSELDDFFQFAFHPRDTIKGVSDMGFELVKSFGRSGSLGFYEDAGSFAKLLFLKPDSQSLLPRIIWRGTDIILRPVSYHMKYFLFRKKA